jgi:hypothetical protein
MKANTNLNDLHKSIRFVVILVCISVMFIIATDWFWFRLFRIIAMWSHWFLRLNRVLLALALIGLLRRLGFLLFN